MSEERKGQASASATRDTENRLDTTSSASRTPGHTVLSMTSDIALSEREVDASRETPVPENDDPKEVVDSVEDPLSLVSGELESLGASSSQKTFDDSQRSVNRAEAVTDTEDHSQKLESDESVPATESDRYAMSKDSNIQPSDAEVDDVEIEVGQTHRDTAEVNAYEEPVLNEANACSIVQDAEQESDKIEGSQQPSNTTDDAQQNAASESGIQAENRHKSEESQQRDVVPRVHGDISPKIESTEQDEHHSHDDPVDGSVAKDVQVQNPIFDTEHQSETGGDDAGRTQTEQVSKEFDTNVYHQTEAVPAKPAEGTRDGGDDGLSTPETTNVDDYHEPESTAEVNASPEEDPSTIDDSYSGDVDHDERLEEHKTDDVSDSKNTSTDGQSIDGVRCAEEGAEIEGKHEEVISIPDRSNDKACAPSSAQDDSLLKEGQEDTKSVLQNTPSAHTEESASDILRDSRDTSSRIAARDIPDFGAGQDLNDNRSRHEERLAVRSPALDLDGEENASSSTVGGKDELVRDVSEIAMDSPAIPEAGPRNGASYSSAGAEGKACIAGDNIHLSPDSELESEGTAGCRNQFTTESESQGVEEGNMDIGEPATDVAVPDDEDDLDGDDRRDAKANDSFRGELGEENVPQNSANIAATWQDDVSHGCDRSEDNDLSIEEENLKTPSMECGEITTEDGAPRAESGAEDKLVSTEHGSTLQSQNDIEEGVGESTHVPRQDVESVEPAEAMDSEVEESAEYPDSSKDLRSLEASASTEVYPESEVDDSNTADESLSKEDEAANSELLGQTLPAKSPEKIERSPAATNFTKEGSAASDPIEEFRDMSSSSEHSESNVAVETEAAALKETNDDADERAAVAQSADVHEIRDSPEIQADAGDFTVDLRQDSPGGLQKFNARDDIAREVAETDTSSTRMAEGDSDDPSGEAISESPGLGAMTTAEITSSVNEQNQPAANDDSEDDLARKSAQVKGRNQPKNTTSEEEIDEDAARLKQEELGVEEKESSEDGYQMQDHNKQGELSADDNEDPGPRIQDDNSGESILTHNQGISFVQAVVLEQGASPEACGYDTKGGDRATLACASSENEASSEHNNDDEPEVGEEHMESAADELGDGHDSTHASECTDSDNEHSDGELMGESEDNRIEQSNETEMEDTSVDFRPVIVPETLFGHNVGSSSSCAAQDCSHSPENIDRYENNAVTHVVEEYGESEDCGVSHANVVGAEADNANA